MSLSRWPVLFSMLLVCSGMVFIGCESGGGGDDSSDPPATNAPSSGTSGDDSTPAPTAQTLGEWHTGSLVGKGIYTSPTVKAPADGFINVTVVSPSGEVKAQLHKWDGGVEEGTGSNINLRDRSFKNDPWYVTVENQSIVMIDDVGISIVWTPVD